jgi:hypothetical protein
VDKSPSTVRALFPSTRTKGRWRTLCPSTRTQDAGESVPINESWRWMEPKASSSPTPSPSPSHPVRRRVAPGGVSIAPARGSGGQRPIEGCATTSCFLLPRRNYMWLDAWSGAREGPGRRRAGADAENGRILRLSRRTVWSGRGQDAARGTGGEQRLSGALVDSRCRGRSIGIRELSGMRLSATYLMALDPIAPRRRFVRPGSSRPAALPGGSMGAPSLSGMPTVALEFGR